MKFEMTDKNMKLILIVVVVLLVVCTVRFGFLPILEKKSAVDDENEVLQAQLDERKEKKENEEIYLKTTEEKKNSVIKLLQQYSGGTSPERMVAFTIGLENGTGSHCSVINFGTDAEVYRSSKLPDMKEVVGYQTSLNLTYQSGYEALKKMIDYVNNYPEYMNISELSAAFDASTGILNGTMTVNIYSFVGGPVGYRTPVVSDVMIRNPNLFGTIE